MAEEFSKAVEEGIKLSKRIYFGNDRAVTPPKPPTTMVKSNTGFLPTSPMVYAVIYDPSIVDNPDIPSYQPHVHGRCDPPALIPLQMINVVECKVDCYLDSAFVEVVGSWRLHCVSGSKSCDCVVAVPMGSQGSILGVEVSVHRKSYSTQLVDMEYKTGGKDGGKENIDGGSNLSIKLNWSQKLICGNDVFSLNVPFNFPDFVNPVGKRMSKKEKIQINVNAATGSEVTCKTSSHPMKEVKRNAGSKSFSNETDVLSWSKFDINFSYAVSSSQINGGFFLESASVDDIDQREMFCMYLSSGNRQSTKVFRKDIVFVIDISGSMRGKLMEDMKNALSAALSKLDPGDSFSIIAFNGEIYRFSTSMEMASQDAVDRAIEWININFIAGDLVEPQMRKMFDKASSLVLANITIDLSDDLEEFEVYPSHIPDLSSDGPLTLSGKYKGRFPEVLKVKGILADFSNFEINLELQNAKDMPVESVFAREQIEYLTAQAWLTSSKEIEQKVSKKKKVADVEGERLLLLPKLGIGFGNLTATVENIPPGAEEPLPDSAEMMLQLPQLLFRNMLFWR
ncbi:hypothetical protein TSUD_373990 [Trifolium subterraneum]|uniref:VWFA domain-containing protein n=1 Tax=Trifolium subterraneum TaxID=3900 RepID=A0A2Z6NYI8_TRISU|nr:hypothetical protein TSUD_373990 [Trifolium subterraneum]